MQIEMSHPDEATSANGNPNAENICDHPGCSFSAKDFRGLTAHKRSHEKGKCKHCDREFTLPGIGSHERWCEKQRKERAKATGAAIAATLLKRQEEEAEQRMKDALRSLFPEGIPVDKFHLVNRWLEATREMVDS